MTWNDIFWLKTCHFFKYIPAGLRLGLKNRQVGEKWVYDDCSYLCKGFNKKEKRV
jgi:hypothetical protein